jgi:pteridine reductase
MLTQTAAVNFAPDIRVNGVLPGPVMKPPKGLSDDQWNAIGRDTTLLQTTGNAEDVARAVSYLARESYITGALIHVNGGEHLR